MSLITLLQNEDEQIDFIQGETIASDVDVETILGRPEGFNREAVIMGHAVRAIEHLDEGVGPAAPEDPRHDGEAMPAGGVDDLEVPAFEERRPLPTQAAMVAVRMERAAQEVKHLAAGVPLEQG